MTKEEALESPLMKLVIEMNEEELEKDGKTAEEILQFMDKQFEFYDIKPNVGGIYLGNGTKDDMADLGCGGFEVFDDLEEAGLLKYLSHCYFYLENNHYDDDYCRVAKEFK